MAADLSRRSFLKGAAAAATVILVPNLEWKPTENVPSWFRSSITYIGPVEMYYENIIGYAGSVFEGEDRLRVGVYFEQFKIADMNPAVLRQKAHGQITEAIWRAYERRQRGEEPWPS